MAQVYFKLIRKLWKIYTNIYYKKWCIQQKIIHFPQSQVILF